MTGSLGIKKVTFQLQFRLMNLLEAGEDTGKSTNLRTKKIKSSLSVCLSPGVCSWAPLLPRSWEPALGSGAVQSSSPSHASWGPGPGLPGPASTPPARRQPQSRSRGAEDSAPLRPQSSPGGAATPHPVCLLLRPPHAPLARAAAASSSPWLSMGWAVPMASRSCCPAVSHLPSAPTWTRADRPTELMGQLPYFQLTLLLGVSGVRASPQTRQLVGGRGPQDSCCECGLPRGPSAPHILGQN